MKIAQLTPGTGNFHCGSCLRDHALVTALRQLGHDALMVPLYLPPVLETPPQDGDREPIFLGGLNVYLQQKHALFRHTPGMIDRLFNAGWILRRAAEHAGMTRAHELGEMTVSMLRGEEGRQVKELRKLTHWLKHEAKPDVVCLSNALLLGAARMITRELGVPLICTLQGEDGFLDSLPEPWRSQSWDEISRRAREVDGFIAVSDYYAHTMWDRLGVDRGLVHTVYNGIDTTGMSPGVPEQPTIGYLARLCEVKGLRTLTEAFIKLKRDSEFADAQLLAVGAATPTDRPLLEDVQTKLESAGVAKDAVIQPNVDRERKITALRSMSVLSVPAEYGESFGLYVLEALACGVPFVQPDHAAFPELLTHTGGGILYPRGDVDALADRLGSLLRDNDRRRQLGETGRAAVLQRFTSRTMAEGVAAVCQTTGGRG